MKKSIILIAAAVLCAVGAQAQRFDWAKGYGSSMANSGCSVQGSLTDSAGNLYILGQYRFDSRWEDEYIRPPAPYFDTEILNLLIAKITPDGTMAWKKVVQSSDNNTYAHDIKPLGDTGFAVLFQSTISIPGSEYLYWLDSLHYSDYYPLNCYQYPDRRFSDVLYNAWLAFDFDGNVKEQYIIQLSGVDTGGNDIMWQPYPNRPDSLLWMVMKPMQRPSFDVDSAGNIYICRDASDRIGASTHYYQPGDSLAAIKVWVNHREVGMFPVEKKPEWVPHLLKFAPHFDTLLNSRYVIQETGNASCNIKNHLKINGDNIVLTYYTEPNISSTATLVFDSIYNLSITLSDKNLFKGFITIHDLWLEPQKIIHLEDSIINQANYLSYSWITDIKYEKDSNLFIISGYVRRNPSGSQGDINSLFMYQNHVLDLNSNAFVLILKGETLDFSSIGIFPSITHASLSINGHENIATQNNRIFLQGLYMTGLTLPTDTIYTDHPSHSGTALSMFDYQGHLIDGIDYNTFAIDNRPGPLTLRDSTLYLVNLLKADADFGEHHVYAAGYDPFVCIAKYVDASFMTPYVYVPPTVPEDSSGVQVIQMDDACRVYPNPATKRLTVATEEPLVAATAISTFGTRTPVAIQGTTLDISPLPTGIYILEIVTANYQYHDKIIKR